MTASPSDGRGTADEGPRCQQVRKRRPPQPAQLGYSTRTPDVMSNRTGPRRAQPAGVYIARRARKPAVPPPSVPPAARRHKAPTPVGADLMPARPLPPCGCPQAARPRSLALRHAAAILGRRDRSRRGLLHPASRESVRGLPDPLCRRRPRCKALTSLRASLRDTLIGCPLWPSWWRIIRSAPTRRGGSNLITWVCSISP